jgi:predicted O-methyltransferase YrrM
MLIDPYFIKRLPRTHPKRLLYTAWCRGVDYSSKLFFDEYGLPMLEVEGAPQPPADVVWGDTQVDAKQMSQLLHALRLVAEMEGVAVEIGAWRGVTTRLLAQATPKTVFAVDPYIGSGSEGNFKAFQDRVAGLRNVVLLRMTSGEAARSWHHGPICFAFVDAAHDYANVAHDVRAWRPHLLPGALMAFHDTDNPDFAGCRRAVFEVADQFRLIAHVPNLVILANR